MIAYAACRANLATCVSHVTFGCLLTVIVVTSWMKFKEMDAIFKGGALLIP